MLTFNITVYMYMCNAGYHICSVIMINCVAIFLLQRVKETVGEENEEELEVK